MTKPRSPRLILRESHLNGISTGEPVIKVSNVKNPKTAREETLHGRLKLRPSESSSSAASNVTESLNRASYCRPRTRLHCAAVAAEGLKRGMREDVPSSDTALALAARRLREARSRLARSSGSARLDSVRSLILSLSFSQRGRQPIRRLPGVGRHSIHLGGCR